MKLALKNPETKKKEKEKKEQRHNQVTNLNIFLRQKYLKYFFFHLFKKDGVKISIHIV
jgi:hypothetical protein